MSPLINEASNRIFGLTFPVISSRTPAANTTLEDSNKI